MEKMLSRRDFLKLAGLAGGVFVAKTFLDGCGVSATSGQVPKIAQQPIPGDLGKDDSVQKIAQKNTGGTPTPGKTPTPEDILKQGGQTGESCRRMGGWSTCRPERDWEGLHIWAPAVCNKGVTGRIMTEAKRSSAGDQWCNGNAPHFYYTSDFCCDGLSLPNK